MKVHFFALGKDSFSRLSIIAEDRCDDISLRHSFSIEGENEGFFSGCLRVEGTVYGFKCAPVAQIIFDLSDSS